MADLFTKQSMMIQAGQAVSGIGRIPCSVRVVSGRVWLTMDGSLSDYWLYAGDIFPIPPGHLIVIEADTESSRIEVMMPSERTRTWTDFFVCLAMRMRQIAHEARRFFGYASKTPPLDL